MNHSSPYRPGREIARGGMGAVLDARDQKLGRSVAMKVMLRRNASEEEQQRFLQEARVLGQLAHPNIVPVHDVGTDEQGRLFYTMKLVQGVTLHEVIGKLKAGDKDTLAKYPLNALLTIFQKVCDAVAFAHSRGIIHRDLKPQNIMVGEFGEVLVMDWGLAKILPGSAAEEEAAKTLPLRGQLGQTGPTGTLPVDGRAALPRGSDDPQVVPADVEEQATLVSGSATPTDEATIASGAGNASAPKPMFRPQEPAAPTGTYATLEGAVMGTPHYMSPEQAEGRISDLDGRSDIFSLGGILYALLTLRPPVEGESLEEILSKVRRGNITPPSAFNAGNSRLQPHDKPNGGIVEPKKIIPLLHLPDGRVPAALSSVVMKALALQREARYPDVAALVTDITAFQGGFATSAENATVLTLFTLFIRRHKALATAAALIVLLSMGFVIKLVASEDKATRNAKTAQDNERRAVTNETRVVQTLAELRRTAPVFFAQAKIVFEEGDFDQAIEKSGYAIQLDDSNADYLLFRANLRESSQELVPAAADYRRVLALRPADAAARTNLALCERLLRETGGAPLGFAQQSVLLTALRAQKRLLEAAPLAALIDPDTKDARAAILSRLREARTQRGWSAATHLISLPDGTFRVSLRGVRPIDFSVLKGQPVSVLDLYRTGIADLSSLAGLPLKELHLENGKATDLSPLRGMPLEKLDLTYTLVSDLSPLRGMKLKWLNANNASAVHDLNPLAGMPLTFLSCNWCTNLSDLTPLAKLQLNYLVCGHTKVTNIAPLRGMPLRFLSLDKTRVTDLSPLAGCNTLEEIVLPSAASDLSMLRRLPRLKLISHRGTGSGTGVHPAQTAEEFWKEYDAKQAAGRK